MPGTFVISLDYELFWGVRDKRTIAGYGENLRGTREAVPAMLHLFATHGLRATWATVGFLFFDRKDDLLAHLPAVRPAYANTNLSPYPALAEIGVDEAADPYHFGLDLLRQIQATPGQEIGTHTFCHYYALERGQTAAAFRADLEAAIAAGRRVGVEIKSLVFPRNQSNAEYLVIARELGLTSYRGNEPHWIYKERSEEEQALWKRGARLLDAYLNLSGHHTFRLEDVAGTAPPFNLPASRFLRPWSARLAVGEELRLRRIEAGMTHAAHTGEVFHLWWHPENFGANLTQNMANLTRLARHFDALRTSHGFQSATRGDLAARLLIGRPGAAAAVASTSASTASPAAL
ncbi:MAG: polysaccharide deacetylase family protein [Hymenobacteraceae bacterium]|nr:polysaccharide deacetylase family protein [Hymenobacteraceae bacterium]